MHLRRSLSVHLHQAHDLFIAEFGSFDSQNPDTWIVDGEQAETAAECAPVLGRLKSDQRRTQPICLPIGLAFAPIAGVPRNPEQYFVDRKSTRLNSSHL